MSPNCPVCEEDVSVDARRCEHCGVPSALFTDARRVLAEPEAPTRGKERPTRASVATVARVSGPSTTDTQAELCSRLAHEMRTQTYVLERLGGDAPAMISEMSQAALTQADGRLGEALGLLRNAHSRVVLQAAELFERRCAEIERRQRALAHDGIGISLEDAAIAMRAAWQKGQADEAIRQLTDADHRLSRIESDWSGLRSLLAQIDTLRDAIKSTGRDLPQVEDDVRQVRDILARSTIDVEGLDTAAQTAARALMLLHESLPPVLERELLEHAERIHRIPADHEGGRRARDLHAEATRHLRRGRLADASAGLRELRKVVLEVEASLPPPPVAPPAAAPAAPRVAPRWGTAPAAAPTSETLGRLLVKARELAARVRLLPPESELAFEAAAEIRRATELLRIRKLDEAESALARLMTTLDVETPGGG